MEKQKKKEKNVRFGEPEKNTPGPKFRFQAGHKSGGGLFGSSLFLKTGQDQNGATKKRVFFWLRA